MSLRGPARPRLQRCFGPTTTLRPVSARWAQFHTPWFLCFVPCVVVSAGLIIVDNVGKKKKKKTQVEKLRMLSIVSLAHTSKVVAYSTMKAALGMDNVRCLEDLIFDTMYSGLLQGKLDQRQELLKVKRTKTLTTTLACGHDMHACQARQ